MTGQSRRFGEKYFLPIVILLILSLAPWTAARPEGALSITVEKGHPKIESSLFDLQQRYLLHGKEASRALALQRDFRIDAQDRVTVFILPRAGETKEAIDTEALRAYGGEVIKAGQSVIKAKVPVFLLDQIADHVKGVNFIKRPDRPYAEVVSEGVGLTGASLYQASGFAGQNTKVAVIDLGFAELDAAIGAGVLPQTVVRIDCSGAKCVPTDFPSEEENHGTAVTEIIHDMAPGAQLYLIKIEDNLDLASAKDYCIANGIRVVNHSVGWFNSNFYDGACYFDNPVCTADQAYKNGILWVNSAGNHARRHYGAAFTDPDGDGLHNVTSSSNFLSLHAFQGDVIDATLTWDAWPATDQDYDLLLYDGLMTLVASSTNVQDGTQPPEEEVYYVAPASGTYYLAVKNSNTTASHRFSVFTFYHDLNPYVAPSSLLSPADAAGVMAVAAINYSRWQTGPQESFSSQGPTTDGRIKPEISGPDGVSSYVYGSFLGTSASSPHVAGAAALVLSNNTGFTVSQLWNSLTSSAIDLGAAGQDPVFGFGRLNLAALVVDPASIDFGGVPVGSFLDRILTLQNIGSSSLAIGAIAASGDSFTVVADSCSGMSLPLGGTCTLGLRFSPPSPGDFSGALTVPSSDPARGTVLVPLTGKGRLVVSLASPADGFSADTCSMKNPPVFKWEANAAVTGYELQFSIDPAFGSVPIRIKTSKTTYIMTSSQWKKVLTIPGASGGTVYWRVMGTTSGGNPEPSNNRTILVAAARSVGDPEISPVSRSSLPILAWENNCNVKSKVWFGSDQSFSKKMSSPISDSGSRVQRRKLLKEADIRPVVKDSKAGRGSDRFADLLVHRILGRPEETHPDRNDELCPWGLSLFENWKNCAGLLGNWSDIVQSEGPA